MIIPIILCGGAGTRLWPLSREAAPKQFMKIFGERSLFQMTLERFGTARDRAMIVGNILHRPVVERQVRELGAPPPVMVMEPARRDSAAAIAAAVVVADELYGEEAVLVVVPSDALIKDAERFRAYVDQAAKVAKAGSIVTFGVAPTRAATEFGYIEKGATDPSQPGAFRVQRFKEKPTAEVAESYLATGRYLWNSGMFVFEAATFLREARVHMPKIVAAATKAVALASRDGSSIFLDGASFGAAPKVSIDYALIEKTSSIAVIAVDFDWSDVGNWRAAGEAIGADARGNVIVGDVKIVDGRNVLAIGENVPVRIMGLSNIAVIACAEGVLVVPLERTAEIKALVE